MIKNAEKICPCRKKHNWRQKGDLGMTDAMNAIVETITTMAAALFHSGIKI